MKHESAPASTNATDYWGFGTAVARNLPDQMRDRDAGQLGMSLRPRVTERMFHVKHSPTVVAHATYEATAHAPVQRARRRSGGYRLPSRRAPLREHEATRRDSLSPSPECTSLRGLCQRTAFSSHQRITSARQITRHESISTYVPRKSRAQPAVPRVRSQDRVAHGSQTRSESHGRADPRMTHDEPPWHSGAVRHAHIPD